MVDDNPAKESDCSVVFRKFTPKGLFPTHSIFDNAARFASTLRPEDLISISHAGFFGKTSVVVWYRESE